MNEVKVNRCMSSILHATVRGMHESCRKEAELCYGSRTQCVMAESYVTAISHAVAGTYSAIQTCDSEWTDIVEKECTALG